MMWNPDNASALRCCETPVLVAQPMSSVGRVSCTLCVLVLRSLDDKLEEEALRLSRASGSRSVPLACRKRTRSNLGLAVLATDVWRKLQREKTAESQTPWASDGFAEEDCT